MGRNRDSISRARQAFQSPISIFCIFASFGALAVLLCLFFSKGQLIGKYFASDPIDTGMDFFHSIEYMHGRSPYETFSTLYPPLANLFFGILYYFVPRSVSGAWPMSFAECVAMRKTALDTRTDQATMLLFIIVVIVTAAAMMGLCVWMLRRYGYLKANLASLMLLLGPGMAFAFERGNILFISVLLTLFFLCFHNSQNKLARELSLLSLAAAAGLKLYPAFFGVLLLRDRQFGRAARVIVYGVLSVFVPLLFFKEGLGGLPQWLAVVFDFGAKDAAAVGGTSFASILHRIVHFFERPLHVEIQAEWFVFAGYAVTALLLAAALVMKEEWQSVLAAALAVILVQSQGRYIYSFMCLPLAMYLAAKPQITKADAVPFAVMVLLCIHVPLFLTRGSQSLCVYYRQAICLAAVIWCMAAAVKNLKHRKMNRSTGPAS